MRRFHSFVKLEDGLNIRLRKLRKKGLGYTNSEVVKNCVDIVEMLLIEIGDGYNLKEEVKKMLEERRKMRFIPKSQVATEPFV